MSAKSVLLIITGTIGASISSLFGGWDAGLTTLIIFMGIDYTTGLLTGMLSRSTKSRSGKLSSKSAFAGIIKKFVYILIVVVGHRLDILMNTTLIRDGVVMAFMLNEVISILENSGRLGVPIPAVLTKVIEQLNKESL